MCSGEEGEEEEGREKEMTAVNTGGVSSSSDGAPSGIEKKK